MTEKKQKSIIVKDILNHRGVIEISRDMLFQLTCNNVHHIFTKFITLRTENKMGIDSIVYYGVSEEFREVGAGEKSPRYTVHVREGVDGKPEKIWFEEVKEEIKEGTVQAVKIVSKEEENDMEHCPECGKKRKTACRCPRNDSTCEEGHTWHFCVVCEKIVMGKSNHGKDITECTCGGKKKRGEE